MTNIDEEVGRIIQKGEQSRELLARREDAVSLLLTLGDSAEPAFEEAARRKAVDYTVLHDAAYADVKEHINLTRSLFGDEVFARALRAAGLDEEQIGRASAEG